MSYLLDALRKSELERRVGEVPNLSPDFTIQASPRTRNRWIFLIVALIVINLGTLLYISFIDRGRPDKVGEKPLQPSPVRSTVETTEQAIRRPIHKSSTEAEPRVEPSSDGNSGVSIKNPSVAEQPKPVLSGKTQPARLVPTAKAPPVMTENHTPKAVGKRGAVAKSSPQLKTPTTVQHTLPKKKTSLDRSQKPAQSRKMLTTPLHREKSKIAGFKKLMPVKPTTVTNTPSGPKARSIPFLAGMPRDFQREFPTLNINVFVYSEDPKERFVIIDMVKYVAGQKMDSGAEILELRPDSVVFNYRGRKFRVKRP